MTVSISPLEIGLYVTVGAAVGAVYFLLLLKTARLHAAQASASRVVPLYIARLAAAVGVFWIVAQQGALPLLLTLAGFVIARFAIQRRTVAD